MATLVVCLAPVVSPKDGTVALVAMAAALAADLVVSVAMAATLVYVVGPVVAMATPTAGGLVGLVVGFVPMAAAPVGSVGPAVAAVAMAADCSVALAVPMEDACLLLVVVDPAYVVVVGPMDVVVVHVVLPTDVVVCHVVVVVVVCHVVVVADGHAGVVDLAPGRAARASAMTRECLQGSQAKHTCTCIQCMYVESENETCQQQEKRLLLTCKRTS